jgi:uncharacterized membrane protein YfcA
MTWLLVLAVGFVAGTVGGVVGFGGSTILLPVLVWSFGPKAAVPIMGVAALLANLARILVWWRTVDWRAAAVYSAAAVPAVALGARTFLSLDARIVEGLIGIFMLAMIPARRWFLARSFRIGLGGLAAAGAVIGFLTGMVANTGPINTPFFLAYGLVKGPFIATEATGSLAVYAAKSAVFERFGALPADMIVNGVIVGLAMMAGAWTGKRIVERMDARRFDLALDAMMAISGIAMVWAALAV